ncbi:hypothetical protein BU23DRAFT_281643 [Bimuria novae-zelandiae CBS 107.79]|uniref:F-box domain-containing protein n=1 Tax=Bimuria novae-zelandiae CBS 107.79 TaxID=1447943 RepID=A0A6A5UVP9_9PLEO|nr:hypothetical protein BU23DRAFT_281643 [Bimuria novae-zelandiae CBS 107.79]
MAMRSQKFSLLPAEIRNRIYAYCTPVHAHPEEFQGLLLASRQIRTEYECEALKVMQQYMDEIKRQWSHTQEIRFAEPKTFGDLAKITVQLPLSLYFPKNRREWSKGESYDRTRLDLCLGPLYSLHVSKLTFSLYDDLGRFVNWSPHAIPSGLLHDMLSPICGLQLPRPIPDGYLREFRIHDPVHIRKLEYNWGNSKVAHSTNLNSLVEADVETANFFLQNSGRFQEPLGLVQNWGRGADSIWFMMREFGNDRT